jgi:hypothetical protein
MITLKDAITSSGSYPDRETHPELTPDVILGREEILTEWNKVLDQLVDD